MLVTLEMVANQTSFAMKCIGCDFIMIRVFRSILIMNIKNIATRTVPLATLATSLWQPVT
jgi:hypothetical protein